MTSEQIQEMLATYPEPAKDMTLRDYFAGRVVSALASFSELHDRGILGVAHLAYEVADAMLKVREETR